MHVLKHQNPTGASRVGAALFLLRTQQNYAACAIDCSRPCLCSVGGRDVRAASSPPMTPVDRPHGRQVCLLHMPLCVGQLGAAGVSHNLPGTHNYQLLKHASPCRCSAGSLKDTCAYPHFLVRQLQALPRRAPAAVRRLRGPAAHSLLRSALQRLPALRCHVSSPGAGNVGR